MLLLSACAPAETQDHSNIIPFRPQVHKGQCPDADPYENVSKEAFYANYTPACCLTNSKYRTKHGLLSGSKEVPGQFAVDAPNRPMADGKFIRNTTARYAEAREQMLRHYDDVLKGVEVLNPDKAAYNIAEYAKTLEMKLNWTAKANLDNVKFRMIVRYQDDTAVGLVQSGDMGNYKAEQSQETVFRFDTQMLAEGRYYFWKTGEIKTVEQLIEYYEELVSKYHIISIR